MGALNVVLDHANDTAGVLHVSGNHDNDASPEIRLDRPPPRAHPKARAPPRKPFEDPVQSRPPARDMRETFGALANPTKLAPEEDGASMYSQGTEGMTDDGDHSEPPGDDEYAEDVAQEDQEPDEHELSPSEGYRTIDDEKADIAFKLSRLKKRGVPGLRQFNAHSDIRDMRSELNRIKTEMELDASLKFQRKMLMAVVGGLEFANHKYSPFELQLDGWSETVHENLTEYDSVFEQLFFKYRNKVKMPPELSLIVMVGGSAMMFHYTNSLMKSAAMPKISPEVMQSMMQTMQQQQPQQQQPPQQQTQPSGTSHQRPELRGPGLDISSLLGGLPSMMPTMPAPMSSRPPPTMPVIQEVRVEKEESERLSDIVSADLSSVVSDELMSVNSEFKPAPRKRGVKNISFSESGPKKRGKKPAIKNVVVI